MITTVQAVAQHVHDFLLAYDPAFGYAEGLVGEQNETEWRETIATDLTTEAGCQRWIKRVSELIAKIPESKPDGDYLICQLIFV